MGCCFGRSRNDSKEECRGLNQNEEGKTLINCRKSQSTATDQKQVTENTCGSGSGDQIEIDLIVLSPLPDGVKRFYKTLEENLRKVRFREVPVNDFMENKTGNNLGIVICSITTRALSDVTATLDKIKDDMRHRIFLICLHWKSPTEAAVSAAENIVKRDFPSIKETVDMAYYRIKDIEGLHTCDLNKKALATIERHIEDGDFTKK